MNSTPIPASPPSSCGCVRHEIPLRRSAWAWLPAAALGLLGAGAFAAADSWPLRFPAAVLPALACCRAIWLLLPGLGGVEALRCEGGAWSLRRRGRWWPVHCSSRLEVRQAGWWLAFRGAGGRSWVWLEMRPGDPPEFRALARELRSGSGRWPAGNARPGDF